MLAVMQYICWWCQAPTKQQIALGPQTSYRGYQQLGANVTRYVGGFQRDWHEAIDLYKEETDMVRHIASAAHTPSTAALEPCRRLHGQLLCGSTHDALKCPGLARL